VAQGNGAGQHVSGDGNIAIGNDAGVYVSASRSMSLGNASRASADDAIALGSSATAAHANSVALGAGSVTTRGAQSGYKAAGLAGAQSSAGEVALGNRQVTGVAPGSASTDATNVGQVQGMVKEGVDSANAYTDTVAAQGLPLGKAYTDTTAARLQGQIDDTARRAYAGIAGVAAMEAAPLVPGKVSYAVGLGNYRSESAVGGSLRHTAQSGRYSVTLGVGATSAGVVTRVALTGVFD
jgi:autotransporter adhesin